MCGIFGFALAQTLPLSRVFRLLEKLEIHQYPHEPKPVGGYGAGIAVILNDGVVVSEKVGWISDSPARSLSKIFNVKEASVLVGHVRMPSPQFMETAKARETAQPYITKCHPDLTVVSCHNGSVTNYRELRERMGEAHVFESENVGLIDSEVIPHLFEEALREGTDSKAALNAVHSALDGSSTVSLMQVERERAFLHFIHKGKTRGLTVWANIQGEVIFCSRREPLTEVFGDLLAHRGFKEKVAVQYHEEASLTLSFPLTLSKE